MNKSEMAAGKTINLLLSMLFMSLPIGRAAWFGTAYSREEHKAQ
jgi:hypothetical protein